MDRDKAVFTELPYDITSTLTLNAGIRYYTFDNTLQGFYGFNAELQLAQPGVAICCNRSYPFHGAPCTDLNGRTTGSGNTPKINLQYKIDPRQHGVCDVVEGLPAGRHQPQRRRHSCRPTSRII